MHLPVAHVVVGLVRGQGGGERRGWGMEKVALRGQINVLFSGSRFVICAFVKRVTCVIHDFHSVHPRPNLLHVYLHREPQVRLICSWCMKICLRRAARISTERLISVQTDEQTEIDMETNMAVNMGDKSVYIRPSGLENISQSIKSIKYPK